MAIIKNSSQYKNEHFIKKLDNIDEQKIVGKNITLSWLSQGISTGQLPMATNTILQ
jgi:hypothetical protein